MKMYFIQSDCVRKWVAQQQTKVTNKVKKGA